MAPHVEEPPRREEAGSSPRPLGVTGGRREHARLGGATREPAGESAVDAGASAPASTVPDTALRHPTTKPKVQLDPDNPWP
jgi:hypothetical protein